MRTKTHDVSFQGDGEEIVVDVEYEYHGGSFGARDSLGVPLEPDEPESVEVIGTSVPVTPGELERIEEACLQYEKQLREPDYD